MAELCHSGVLPLLGPLAGAIGGDLLTSRLLTACRPQEGICFSSINRVGGQETVQVGCWPSQTTITGLAWLGAPKCRTEINRLVCLCRSNLCNSLVPVWPQHHEPEGDEIQGSLIIFLLFFMVVIVLGVICHTSSRFCRSQTNSPDFGHQEHDIYIQRVTPSPPHQENNPPPLLRVHSAPPNLQSDPNRMKPPINSHLLPLFKVTLGSEFSPQDISKLYDVTDHYSLLLGYKKMTKTTDV